MDKLAKVKTNGQDRDTGKQLSEIKIVPRLRKIRQVEVGGRWFGFGFEFRQERRRTLDQGGDFFQARSR